MLNARIDDKGSTIAVHHRRVAEKRKGEMKRRAYDLAERFEGSVHFTEGKKVFDYFPVDAASKGSAARTLLAQQGGIEAVLSIYCGDDITDEPAFEALPPQTITVYVGLTPGDTAARYRVDDPGAAASLALARSRIPRLGDVGSARILHGAIRVEELVHAQRVAAVTAIVIVRVAVEHALRG